MVPLVRKFARNVAFPMVHFLRLDSLMSAFSSNNVLQITYHGVTSIDYTWFSPRAISASIFEKQLAYFKKNFDIVSVQEALDWKRRKFNPKRKTIAISFDDGYTNNCTVMRPLVEAYQIPVTVFVCGAPFTPSGPRYLWPELVQTMEHFHPDVSFEVRGVVFNKLRAMSNGQSFSNWLKTLLPEDRFEVLNELNDQFGLENHLKSLPSEIWEIMQVEQLKSLSTSPLIDIGVHGHWHSNLGNLSLATALDDLRISKSTLERILGRNMNLLAYPDGCYTRDLIDSAEQLGFTHQLAVTYRHAEDFTDPRIVSRHGIASTTTLESTLFFIHRAFARNNPW
jgi:peptidoglycan/xylan/chitin deacetylase (PgdA/CDA1 family)